MIEDNSRILVPFDATELSLRALECKRGRGKE
jgi:hypothetical protein